MERRLLLVFALTFLVIVLFQPVLKKYLPQAPAPAQQNPSQPQPPPQGAFSSNQSEVARPGETAPNPGATKQASSESETVIENDLYRITFTNRGGQVKSWVLKQFDDDKGRPLELVNSMAAEKYGYPLSLWTYDENQRNKLNSALYLASSSGTVRAPAEITFEYADQDIAVRKNFRFDHTYVVQVETSVSVKGSPVSAYPTWPAGFGDQSSLASYHASRVEYQYNGDTQRLDIKKISSGNTLHVPLNWAGVSDQYFAAVFLPDDPQNAVLVTLRNSLNVPKDPQKPNPQDTAPVDVLGAAVGNPKGPTMERMYVGPKSLKVLESVPVPTVAGAPQDLRALVNFGFFGVIARPLFLWLKWTYERIVGNWGWAIAIQTLIINLALLPPHLQHEIGAEDAENPAADECDQGEIQEVQHARSAPARNEPGDWRADEARGREPSRRLSASRHPDAVPVRLLQHAGRRARPAARALAVDPRSFLAGSVPHPADWHCDHDVVHPENDSPGGHGSFAAENDERHDAGDDGSYQLPAGRRLVSLLVRGQPDYDCTANHTEPDQAGPRNARNGGKASKEEREVKLLAVSLWLLA